MEFARLGFLDIRRAFDAEGNLKAIQSLDDDDAIAGLEIVELFEGRGEDRTLVGYLKKVNLANKIAALDLLAKYLGMFSQRTGISGPEHGPLSIGFENALYKVYGSDA